MKFTIWKVDRADELGSTYVFIDHFERPFRPGDEVSLLWTGEAPSKASVHHLRKNISFMSKDEIAAETARLSRWLQAKK